MPDFKARPADERFDEKVEIAKAGECWTWTASVDGKGYGQFCHAGGKSTMRAHRFAYERAFGPVPDGLLVCHTCDNRRCVNPAHLFVGSHSDNMKDMRRKGRGNSPPSNGSGPRSLCPNGHAYTTENTHIVSRGTRQCIECRLAKERRRPWRPRRGTP